MIKRAAAFAALFLFATTTMTLGQDVTLTSRDGSVTVTGDLLGFDGQFYRVRTEFGELTVDGSGVLCEGPGCPNLQAYVAELDISGAPEIGQLLLPALIQAFAAQEGLRVEREDESERRFLLELVSKKDNHPVARFYIHLNSSGEGFADLLANQTDIVLSTREITPDERMLARNAGLGDLAAQGRARVLALDSLVAIVSNQNPVNNISMTDLSEIYSGKVTNWKTLGPQNAPITPYLRSLQSGVGQFTLRKLRLEGPDRLSEETLFSPRGIGLATGVSVDPFALGLVSRSASLNTKILTLTGSCGRSLRPTRRNIKTEDYPLTAPLFLYLPARRLPKVARDFLTYTRSPAAQLVIRRAGFVDQAPEEIVLNFQGDRLANAFAVAGEEVALEDVQEMVSTLRKKKRLTTSFRFETGSVRLDAQSRSNVEQLATALEAGIYDGRELYFVGFSDGQGDSRANLEISRRRAVVVRKAVEKAAETADFNLINVDVLAYGEAMPMACDDTAWGRQVNRRVEVWVR